MNNGFGERLKTLRIANHLTLEQLAELIDVSLSYMGLVERGKRMFSWHNVVKISRLFSVSLDFLIFGEDSENHNQLENLTIKDELGESEKQFVMIVVHLAKRLEPEGHKLMINFLFDMAKMISAIKNGTSL